MLRGHLAVCSTAIARAHALLIGWTFRQPKASRQCGTGCQASLQRRTAPTRGPRADVCLIRIPNVYHLATSLLRFSSSFSSYRHSLGRSRRCPSLDATSNSQRNARSHPQARPHTTTHACSLDLCRLPIMLRNTFANSRIFRATNRVSVFDNCQELERPRTRYSAAPGFLILSDLYFVLAQVGWLVIPLYTIRATQAVLIATSSFFPRSAQLGA